MLEQTPASHFGPAIPLSGSFSPAPVLSPRATRTVERATAQTNHRGTEQTTTLQGRIDADARAERITRWCFEAFMVLNILGLAVVGYALLSL